MRTDAIFCHSWRTFVWLNLTYDCNFSCPWCYASSVKSNYFMDNQTLEKILFFLKDVGVNRLMLSGGEPTIHPKFLSIVKLCRDRRIKVMANTHGLAFSDKAFLDRAATNGLSLINLSLKAVNAEDFLAYTGFDGFDLQKKAIQNILADERITLSINLMLSRCLIDKFKIALELLLSWGVKSIHVDIARPVSGADPYGRGQIPTAQEALDFIPEAADSLSSCGMDYFFRLDMPLCRFAGTREAKRLSQMNFMTNCFLRDGTALVFGPRGELSPCNILTETVLGRVGEDFSTAKEYDKFMRRNDVVEKIKSLRPTGKPECSSCPLSHKCCRGCAAFKLGEEKSSHLAGVPFT